MLNIKKNNMAEKVLNKLEIIGNDSQVSKVRNFLRGNPLKDGSEQYIDFNKIIPMPLIIAPEEIIAWRWENWGNCWGACEQWLDLPNTIIFTTVFTSVLGLVKKLSSQFPDIEFKYGFDYPNVIVPTWDLYFIVDGVVIGNWEYDGEDCPPIFSK